MKPCAFALLAIMLFALLAACTQQPAADNASTQPAVAATSQPSVADKPIQRAFAPPSESSIPAGPLGDVIRQGRAIFTDTPVNATAYVGNGLSC
ncbi:MAG: cytochrome C, partial [Rhodanobacter sp.]